MRNLDVFTRWLTAATAAAKRGLKDGDEAERDRLWRAVQAEGFTVGECLAALEEKMGEGDDERK